MYGSLTRLQPLPSSGSSSSTQRFSTRRSSSQAVGHSGGHSAIQTLPPAPQYQRYSPSSSLLPDRGHVVTQTHLRPVINPSPPSAFPHRRHEERYPSTTTNATTPAHDYYSSTATDTSTTGSSAADVYSLGSRRSLGSAASSEPPTGFRNLGNTCYMNAALQCILHSSGPLLSLLRTSNVRSMAVESHSSRAPATALTLTEATLRLAESPSSSSLLAVKSCVSQINAEFVGTRQNDSHEFIRELLHGIHRETNRVATKPQYVEMKDIPGEDDVRASQRWKNYVRSHDDSVVYDVFGGFIRSVTKCDVCGHRSLAFDPFLDISLPVMPTLLESIQVMSDLEGITILNCTNCKGKNTPAKQQTVISQWPRCLMIHLKRFSGNGKKKVDPVEYPINLTEHMLLESSIVIPKGTSFPSRGYTLSGVVLHQGTMGFGHYTAMVRHGALWYECDDARVDRTSERSALGATSAAYILFYVQN